MKNKVFFLVFAVFIGICFVACTTFQASGIQMGMSTSGTETLGNFTTKAYVNKFLGQSGGTNFLNLSSDATTGPIRDAIEKEIQKKGGTAAINISIKYGSNPIQWILNYITFNIWAPSTVTISGIVIRQQGGGNLPSINIQVDNSSTNSSNSSGNTNTIKVGDDNSVR
jgi:hypothetical protein